MPDIGFSVDYEVKLLPGQAASLHALKGLLKLDFPADSYNDGVLISVHPGSRLADRPLPGGLDTYLAFTLEGSVIGQGGVLVGKLDKPFKLSHTLDKLGKRDLKIFRWNNEIARWEELSAGNIGDSAILTDYAVGGPPQTGSNTLPTTDGYPTTMAPSSLLTLPSGQVDYLGGYLDLPVSGYNGFVAVGAEDAYWKPGNVGKLNTQPRQLLQAGDGTFYSLGEDGYLRRSDNGYTWTELRKNKSGTLQYYRIVHLQAVGTTLIAAMTTDSNNTDKSGYFKSTDRGDTWTHVWTPPIPSGQTQHMKGVSVSLSPADSNLMYFVAVQDWTTPAVYKVFKSTDGGNTWGNPIYNTSTTAIQKIVPDPSSAQKAFMIRGDGVYKTSDQGATWNLKRAVAQNEPSMGNFLISGDGTKTWYAPGNAGIEMSADNGATWTTKQILPAGSAGKITCLDKAGNATYIYAGVDMTTSMPASNLYMSGDGGATWTDITGDMGTSSLGLHDSYGPMRIRAIIAQTNAPDEGVKYGVQRNNVIYSDGTAAKAGDYLGREGFAGSNGVNTVTGNYFYHRTDFSVDGKGPAMTLTRYYNSKDSSVGLFGKGWSFSYGVHLVELANQMVVMDRECGVHVRFAKLDDGSYSAPGAEATLAKNPNHTQGWELTLKDGTIYKFDATTGSLVSIVDRNGLSVNITYTDATKTKIQSIDDEGDRYATFTYTGNKVTRIDLPLSRYLGFTYTGDLLTSFRNMDGEVTDYTYDTNGYLTGVEDGNNHTQVTNTYDSTGRVLTQLDGAATPNQTTFNWNQRGSEARLGYLTISAPGDTEHIYMYDPSCATLEVTDSYGNSDSYNWNSNGALVNHTDRNENYTRMSWDSMNNQTGTYDAEGRSHNFTYNSMNGVTEERWTLRDERPTDSGAVNKVSNSSFEKDDDGNGIPNDWSAQGTGVSFGISNVNQRYGINSIWMYAGAGATGFFQSSPIAVNSTTTYSLSYDIKTDGLTPSRDTVPAGIVVVTELKADGSWNRDQVLFSSLSGTQDWNRKSASFTVTGSTTHVILRPALAYSQDGNATGTVLFDGILLEAASQAGKYAINASYGYDTNGNLTSIVNPLGKTTTITYDSQGQPSSVIDPMDTAIHISYDGDGNPNQITDGDLKVWHKTYDAAGRLLTETDPISHTVSYEYDNENRRTLITDALNHSTSFTYDDAGNQLTVTDANTNTVTYAYDTKNNLITVTDPMSVTTTYSYDAGGNMTSVTDGLNHTTTYDFDLEGRLTSATTPEGNITQQGYDDAGNVTSRTDANGAVTTFEYDKTYQLKGKYYPGDTPGDPTVSYSYYVNGPLKTMTDDSGTTSYAYDDEGKLTSVTSPQGTLTYQYDDAGRLFSITYPDGKRMEYRYNHRNLLTRVYDWATPARITYYSYDDAGRLATAGYPNTTSMVYSYNNANAVTGIDYKQNGTTFQSVSYQLDNVGNRTRVTDTVGGVDHVRAFTYDDNYRLNYADYNYDSDLNGKMEAFEYDAVGNRSVLTETVDLVDTVTSYTYDDDNRMLTAGSDTFTWDDNGNMLTKTSGGATTTYSYNYENQLNELTVGTDSYDYTYNGNGLRVREVKNNGTPTNYLWDANRDIPEIVQDGTYSYLYGLDLISRTGGAQGLKFFSQDGLGSVKVLTDANGTVTDRYFYKAFGNLLSSTGTDPNYFRFAGEQLDSSSNSYYLRARYYDPTAGRFTARDPLSGCALSPQTQNPYVYVNNCPTRLTDPTGSMEDTGVWYNAQYIPAFCVRQCIFHTNVAPNRWGIQEWAQVVIEGVKITAGHIVVDAAFGPVGMIALFALETNNYYQCAKKCATNWEAQQARSVPQ